MNPQTALKQLKILAKKPKEMRLAAESWSSDFQILVSTIMSARTRDETTIPVAEKLFKKYKTIDDYVKADPREFEKDIRQSGFFRSKTKSILGAAKKIKKDYKGKVPKTMEELLTLPGVARKTANIVLGNAYGVVEGIAVDTHVARLSKKFDLTDNKDPVKIERDLMEILPRADWGDFNHRLVLYGRHVCVRRRHSGCENHPLTKIYPKAAQNWP